MKKYIVVSYEKINDVTLSCIFDSKKEALVFISENYFIDKKCNEQNNWIYKLVEVILF